MTDLLTGCAGFIGWKTTEKLLRSGRRVIGVDNLNDYYDPKLKHWRLSQLQSFTNFQFFQDDVTDLERMRSLFEDSSIERVFNLAARAGVRPSVENPWIYFDTNLTGTLNLLECCRHYEVQNFVLASTSSAYGLNEIPFRADDRTDQALSPYAASKKAAEVLCHSYHYLYGLDIAIPRYFTVYGPAGRPDMAIFRFIKNIYNERPIDVFGDGKQSRDFTYVDDVAEATILCGDLKGYHILNVGNNHPVELLQLIHTIEQALDKKAQPRFSERHRADTLRTWADIDATHDLLGWRPKVPFEQGLARAVQWFLENRDWVNKLD